jgi:hypothetical protein
VDEGVASPGRYKSLINEHPSYFNYRSMMDAFDMSNMDRVRHQPALKMRYLARTDPEQFVNGIPAQVRADRGRYEAYQRPESVARRVSAAHALRSAVEIEPVLEAIGLVLADRAALSQGLPSIMADNRQISQSSAGIIERLRQMAETGQYEIRGLGDDDGTPIPDDNMFSYRF